MKGETPEPKIEIKEKKYDAEVVSNKSQTTSTVKLDLEVDAPAKDLGVNPCKNNTFSKGCRQLENFPFALYYYIHRATIQTLGGLWS